MRVMAEEKTPQGDRHKRKTTQLRLHPLLRRQLEILAAENANTLTAEITTAIREHLKRAGKWPPPTHKPDP